MDDFFSHLFDSDYTQRRDLNKMGREIKGKFAAQDVRGKANIRRIEFLENELGKTQLIVLALVETLRERPEWDEESFAALKDKIDFLDGVADNKVTYRRKKKVVRKKNLNRKVVKTKVAKKSTRIVRKKG